MAPRSGLPAPHARYAADAIRFAITALAVAVVTTQGVGEAVNPVAAAVLAWTIRPIHASARAELLFLALLAIDSILTTTGTMQKIDEQDTFGHLVLPAAMAPIALAAADAAGFVRAGQRPVLVMVLLAATLFGVGVAWELVELVSDSVVGSNASLGPGDTVHDLVCDAIGALVGSALVVFGCRGGRQEDPSGVRAAARVRT